jgi:hypothetical protein
VVLVTECTIFRHPNRPARKQVSVLQFFALLSLPDCGTFFEFTPFGPIVTFNADTRTSAISAFSRNFPAGRQKMRKKLNGKSGRCLEKPVSSKVLTVPILAMGLIANI